MKSVLFICIIIMGCLIISCAAQLTEVRLSDVVQIETSGPNGEGEIRIHFSGDVIFLAVIQNLGLNPDEDIPYDKHFVELTAARELIDSFRIELPPENGSLRNGTTIPLKLEYNADRARVAGVTFDQTTLEYPISGLPYK